MVFFRQCHVYAIYSIRKEKISLPSNVDVASITPTLLCRDESFRVTPFGKHTPSGPRTSWFLKQLVLEASNKSQPIQLIREHWWSAPYFCITYHRCSTGWSSECTYNFTWLNVLLIFSRLHPSTNICSPTPKHVEWFLFFSWLSWYN